jgi:aryl-alcohol dehydrogenase-like predicted oxidoreductase
LNDTTLCVSQLCLGTNDFGSKLGASQAEALLDEFAALGGNFIDTAHSYGDWSPFAPRAASERVIGQWLSRQRRADFVIATKGCEPDSRARAGKRVSRLTPADLAADIRESLECLKLDAIDLYWLHRDDPSQPVEPIIDALIEHQHAGRIRYFGCSNWSVQRIRKAQSHAASLSHPGFSACQPMWGLAKPNESALPQIFLCTHYDEGFRTLHEQGMPMIAYTAQSRGFFTKLAEGRVSRSLGELFLNPLNLQRFERVQGLAAHHGVTPNTIALSYLTSQPLTTVPIIACRTPQQLRTSVSACELRLSETELELLRDPARNGLLNA